MCKTVCGKLIGYAFNTSQTRRPCLRCFGASWESCAVSAAWVSPQVFQSILDGAPAGFLYADEPQRATRRLIAAGSRGVRGSRAETGQRTPTG
jgi:hypothetical protein